MNRNLNEDKLKAYISLKKSFGILENVIYKNLYINDLSITILGIHFMNNGPDWNVSRHQHFFYEFHYVIENDVYTTLNGLERKIGKNQFYVIPPGVQHSHRQDKGAWHRGFALRWEVRQVDRVEGSNNCTIDLDKMNYSISNEKLFPVNDDGRILDLIFNLVNIPENEGTILETQLAFMQVLTALTRYYSIDKGKTAEEVNKPFIESNIVNSVTRFIEENYFEEINVEDIARAAHLSYSYLSRVFRNRMGQTINRYLNDTRLKKAQMMLKCSDKSVEYIARETGFQSIYYFSSVFKKKYGLSPSEYRKYGLELSD